MNKESVKDWPETQTTVYSQWKLHLALIWNYLASVDTQSPCKKPSLCVCLSFPLNSVKLIQWLAEVCCPLFPGSSAGLGLTSPVELKYVKESQKYVDIC